MVELPLNILVSGDKDGIINLWDLTQNRQIKTYQNEKQGKIYAMVELEVGKLAVGSTNDINIYD